MLQNGQSGTKETQPPHLNYLKPVLKGEGRGNLYPILYVGDECSVVFPSLQTTGETVAAE